MDSENLSIWAQALALITAMTTTWLTILRFFESDRLVKRQMRRIDELERVAAVAPQDLVDHIRTLQHEVVADYLATVISGSWRRIGVAKLPMAGASTVVAAFSILTGALIASPVIDMGLRNTGFLIPFSLFVGVPVAGMVGWLALGPVMGRRMLREELHHRFTRCATIEGAVERFDLSRRQRQVGNIVGAVGSAVIFIGLTAGTVATLSLIAGVAQSMLTVVSVVMMIFAFGLALGFKVVASRGPEKYGELVLKRQHSLRSTI